MKRYYSAVPITHGEMTLIASDHAGATMNHSAKLAAGMLESKMNVLNVNCGLSDQRFRKQYYNTIGDTPNATAILHSSDCGDLASDAAFLEQAIVDKQIEVVIISGWEFASSDTRKRQRLIIFLRKIMRLYNVAVIIYAHNANKPEVGKIDKAGVWSLGLLANEVMNIYASEILQLTAEDPVEIRIEDEQPLMSAQLSANKINDLAPMPTAKILRQHPAVAEEDKRAEQFSQSFAMAA